MFTLGESAHGCGHVVRTVFQGVRTTAADYVTKKNARPNIDIKTKVFVDRVVLEAGSGNQSRATGVTLQNASGETSHFKARKEVILSTGTYGTPAILLRSGIGPKVEVEKYGIKSQLDLPGVGKNLLDHLVSWSELDSFMSLGI